MSLNEHGPLTKKDLREATGAIVYALINQGADEQGRVKANGQRIDARVVARAIVLDFMPDK